MKFHIYHHFDADGFAAAAVILRYYFDDMQRKIGNDRSCFEFHVVEHNTPMDLSCVNDDDVVFILDYSFSREDDKENLKALYKKLLVANSYSGVFHDKTRVPIYWIDHHKTSNDIIKEDVIFKDMAAQGLVYISNEYAGCMLAYFFSLYNKKMNSLTRNHSDYRIGYRLLQDIIDLPNKDDMMYNIIKDNCRYMENTAPMWIRLVSDHDTFTHKIPYSSEFCLAVNDAGLYDIFINPDTESFSIDVETNALRDFDFNRLNRYLGYDTLKEPHDLQKVNQLIKTGKLLKGFNDRRNEKIAKNNHYPIIIRFNKLNEGRRYRVCMLNHHGNSEVFGYLYDEYDAVCIYSYNGKVWRYSMYAKKESEMDCSLVAIHMKEKYGLNGGGHEHACGWSTPVPVLLEPDSIYEIDL